MAMLRLNTFHELWKCSHLVASCVTKRKALNLLPVSSACLHHPLLSRRLSSGGPLWKDAIQPKTVKSKERETVDLDEWKSVMRSQAMAGEKQRVNDEEEGSDDEPGGDLKDGSSLEATLDMLEMWRQAGRLVPKEMTDEEVQAFAELTTKKSRKKYLKYLAVRESHKTVSKEKKLKRKAEREASREQSRGQDKDPEDRDGHVMRNSFLLQFWNRSLDKLLAWRSAQAMVFGQPLVFDMSYHSHMSMQELKNTVSQLIEVEAWNRRATEPFHLHYCNLQPDGVYKQELLKRYGAETWERLFITATDCQHVNVFPREQLVYLTADSPNVLRKFDHSKVYIIGALVDRSIHTGLSLANAKRLKLATARLPLDEFLQWEIGAKNLTLDQMIRIMITIKETGKWEEALKFVPQRKHDGFYQPQTQKEIPSKRVRGVTNHGCREDGGRWLRTSDRTFKSESKSRNRSHKQSGFTGRDRMVGLASDRQNKPAENQAQTSFKNSMERSKGASKSKRWWDDEVN